MHVTSTSTGSFVCGRERIGSFRHRQRLGIVGPQTKNEPEPVQQPSAHRMFGDVGEKRVRTLKRTLRFGTTDAMHVRNRYSVKRRERDLQRVALGALWRLAEKGQRMLGEAHARARAQVRERRFGSLNVVAQCGHRIAAKLEVHGEFRSHDRRACAHARVRAWSRLCGGAATEPTGSCARRAPGERARA